MRILIVKLGAIGDVIQMAIAINQYKKYHSNVAIDWVINKELKPFVQSMGVVDNVIGINEAGLVKGKFINKLIELLKAIFFIFYQCSNYAEIYTGYTNWRYKILTLLIFSGKRYSLNSKGFRPIPIQHRHRSFEYLRLMTGNDSRAFDVDILSLELGKSFFIENKYQELNHKIRFIFENINQYVLIIPGGARNLIRSDGLRRWPTEHYNKLARYLINSGFQVVLAGSNQDLWVRDFFNGTGCIDLIGETSLADLAYLIKHASLIVTHDTGPMHLTMLTQTPIIALFGPTPANACISQSRSSTTILQMNNRLLCSPCYDGRNYANCSRALCMELISPELVFDAGIALLTNKVN